MRGSLAELLVVALVVLTVLIFGGKNKIVDFAKSLKESKDILTEDSKKNDEKSETVTEVKENNA